MDKPFPAYRGSDPYIFACYAHENAGDVYPDLILLNENGINVWYDEGIPAGMSWRAEIAGAIKGAGKFLFFISRASIESRHCLREIDYALTHDVEIVPIYLDEAVLPAELDLALSRVQALYRKTDSRYAQHLLDALQGAPRLVPFLPLKRGGNTRALMLGMFGSAVLALLAWTQWGGSLIGGPAGTAPAATSNALTYYLQGQALLERWDKDDNLDTAIELFREAAAADPESALSFARLADGLRIRYALTGDESWLNEATMHAEEALRLNAGLAPVQVALGRIQAMRGNTDVAFAALDRAIAIDANNAPAHQAIASVYARLGRVGDAEASFEKAIALAPDGIEHLDAYANFLYAQGRFEEAVEQWDKVVRLAPDHFAALVNLGAALDAAGRPAESIGMYERALAIRPSYMAYSNLGTAYARNERYADAVDAYRRALDVADTHWLAWGNLAYVYSWMDGMAGEAEAAFERAIELAEAARRQDPRDVNAHSDLALYYAKTRRPELARERLGTAIALSGDSAEVMAVAAEVFESVGERDRAIEFARRALDLGLTRQHLERSPELTGLLSDPAMASIP